MENFIFSAVPLQRMGKRKHWKEALTRGESHCHGTES